MNTIYLHKDKPNTMWQDDETFLCVFDENNNLLVDYDFCSGLKLMQNDKEMMIFIYEKDLVPGKWVLFATKLTEKKNGEYKKTKIKTEGFKNGNFLNKIKKENYENCFFENRISREEREKRLNVCKSCSLFDKEKMICKVNNRMVLGTTQYENQYCPEGKWGDKEKYGGQIKIVPKIDQKEQKDFEEEFEKYLKGK